MSTDEKMEKVAELRKKGLSVKSVLAQVQMSPNLYYSRLRKLKQNYKPKRRKASKLKMLELPMATPQPISKLFCIVGDAASLAEFVRNYQ